MLSATPMRHLMVCLRLDCCRQPHSLLRQLANCFTAAYPARADAIAHTCIRLCTYFLHTAGGECKTECDLYTCPLMVTQAGFHFLGSCDVCPGYFKCHGGMYSDQIAARDSVASIESPSTSPKTCSNDWGTAPKQCPNHLVLLPEPGRSTKACSDQNGGCKRTECCVKQGRRVETQTRERA